MEVIPQGGMEMSPAKRVWKLLLRNGIGSFAFGLDLLTFH